MQALALPTLIHFACATLGLLLALLLLWRRAGNRAANRWLAGYISCLTLLWIGDLLEETRSTLVLPWASHTTDWLIFLVGPCLWMYIRRLTLQQRPSVLSLLLHAVPAAALLGLLTPFYVLPAAAKVEIIKAELATPWDFLNWPLLIAAAQIMGYWVASLLALRRFNATLRERDSALGEHSFDWLQSMLSITLGMWIVWVIGLLFHAPWSQWFAAVAVPPGVYLLAFFGLRQPAVFADEAAGAAPARAPSRYARSGLDRARVPEFLARLESVMRSEKPWLEADLTLTELATRASLSPHNLSQLLNDELDQSFFDYINSHRVAEVKRCLLDPAYGSQAILGIAKASGFSSKTAFNAAFREHAGVTPSEFRRRSRVQSGAPPT